MSDKLESLVVGDVRIRALHESDLDMTRAWRNHPETRKHFFYCEEVSQEQHRAWFEQYRQKNDDYVFIVEFGDPWMPVAQTAIYKVDPKSRSAEFGRFIVDQGQRGRGLGRRSLHATCKIAFGSLRLARLTLEVKPDNEAAIRSYQKAGFARLAEDERSIQMELTCQDWQKTCESFS